METTVGQDVSASFVGFFYVTSVRDVALLFAMVVLATQSGCLSATAEDAKTKAVPPIAAGQSDAITAVRPLPINITTVDGKAIHGDLIATGKNTFVLRTTDGTQTVSWRRLLPRDIYAIHVKLLDGAPAQEWRTLGNLLRTVEGGRELARASYANGIEKASATTRAAQVAELTRYVRVLDTLKELEGTAGRQARMLPLSSLSERIWYSAPQHYEKATEDPQLGQLLADHLATADMLLASGEPKLRRLGLGLATMVADGTARHLENAKRAVDIVEALVLPNLDVADDQAHELSRQTVLGTALYVYRQADQPGKCDDVCRLLLKYSYDANSANAAKYILAQSLAKQHDLVGAITMLHDVQGSGVNPQHINMLASQYRRDLIGGNFQLDLAPSTTNVGPCSGTPPLPLMTLTNAHTREDIWYMAGRVQATVTHPLYFQIGLTNGWCTLEGDWTPATNYRELWMFSDDGCAVRVNGALQLDNHKKGQNLASWREHDWSPSLFKVTTPSGGYLAKTTYHIQIQYIDKYYMNYPYFTDIDGCTLFDIERGDNLALSVLPVKAHVGHSVQITVTATNQDLTPGVGKTVAFTVDGASIGSTVTAGDGTATMAYTPTSAGTKQLGATSSGYFAAPVEPLYVTSP